MSKKVLIIGGVAGGASAAARLRRLDENAEITIFERGNYISFANCGLPYYIGKTITERENLLVATPEAMKAKFNIDVRTNSNVSEVDFDNKKVKVESLNGIYEESYDVLILSPGAKPIKPNIAGINGENIHSLRNMKDTDIIKKYVTENKLHSAIVIGGGFIGVEMAENLIDLNMEVTLVEAAPHILAPFDSDMVKIAENEMERNKVKLILNNGVESFNSKDGTVTVTLKDGTTLSSDLVLLSIGVMPDVAFLKDSGLEFGPKGHIIVNDKLETNIKDVYAVGDAIEVVDFINGNKTAIPLAGPANKQGRIVADNIAGLDKKYKGTQGTSILKVFNLTCASTGNNERILDRNNIPYKSIYVLPNSHASYYPGADRIYLKLIFGENGKILGAQGIGTEGVDKRIDDIATAIRFNGTVEDLTELELAYAPPFSSAKDPVNMAGYYAENVLTGRSSIVMPKDVDSRDKNNVVVLDVRMPEELQEEGYIEGSINIPLQELRNKFTELEQYKAKELWIYCKVGLRGYIAEQLLNSKGFNTKNITGGYTMYSLL
ncbi:hypothetical protein SH2C18_21300 [Clostridium sediminicola]|uniref:FAD-dependent oxidoreductase n=1 Tax=Clostridium sediminicola TaxID=3114879 RepID=UPI0031F20109